jgi:hypothetical protein
LLKDWGRYSGDIDLQGGHWGLHQYPPLGKIPKYLLNTLPQKTQKTSYFPQKTPKYPLNSQNVKYVVYNPEKKSF